MKRSNYLFLFSFLTFSLALSAQTERKITRTGNTQYELGNFVDAEINYKKALEQNANLLQAQFNLGDALAKQDRFEEALASFDLVSSTSEDEQLKANAYHNKGNVQLQQQDLEGAIESYKEALRTNPKDHQTRYNYAYAKKQLEQQQEQQQDQEQDQEQDQDQEQNQDQDQQENENSENKDHQNKEDAENEEQNDSEQEQQDQGDTKEDETQENDQNSGETDGEDAKDDQEEKQGEVKENKLSPEEAQRLLEALKQEENKVQAKMKKHKIKGSKVKIEKDW